MDWIDSVPSQALKQWIVGTKIPMLASMPDGSILWCNVAFEEFLEYSIVELVGDNGKTWSDLTSSSEDAAADLILVAQLEAAARREYTFQKSYRTKAGVDRKCIIHVMRYPESGEFNCCLVSVIPLDVSGDMLLQEMQELRAHQVGHSELLSKILEVMTNKPPSYLERYLEFSKENPIQSAVVTLFLLSLVLGNYVLHIASAIRETFWGSP